MVHIKGHVHPQFSLVKEAFEDNFNSFGEVGAAVTVIYKGKTTVDLYGGWANKETKAPWQHDTLTNVYSCTKAIANICVLHLISHSELTYQTKISSIWPEFGCNGKENITIEQLLSHQTSLNTLQGFQVTSEDLVEWTKYLRGEVSPPEMYSRLINNAPVWDVGAGCFGYNPITVGFYVSEIMKRADPLHRNLNVYWREEIADKYDIDFYMGLSEDFPMSRIAKLYSITSEDGSYSENLDALIIPPCRKIVEKLPLLASKRPFDFDAIPTNFDSSTFVRQSFTVIKRFSPWKTKGCEVPSAVGFGNARALSKIAYMLVQVANGTFRDPHFVDQTSLQIALQPGAQGDDLTLFQNRVFTRGGFCKSENYPGAFYHSGNGGAIIFADVENDFSLSFTPNALFANPSHNNGTRAEYIIRSVYAVISQAKL